MNHWNLHQIILLRWSFQIFDRKSKTLRNKKIQLVKVLWRNHEVEEATWEQEKEIQQTYLELYGTSNFDDEIH